MATKAQIAANRRNAKRSTGPKSPAGKAILSMNALRHGLRAQKTLLPESTPDSTTYTSRKPSPNRIWSSKPSFPSGNWSAPRNSKPIATSKRKTPATGLLFKTA